MKQIWKFELHQAVIQTIKMPRGAKVLTVQLQQGTPCIWAEVDPEEKPENRHISIVLTGQPYKHAPGAVYLGTYQELGGTFVTHAFEVTRA